MYRKLNLKLMINGVSFNETGSNRLEKNDFH